MKKASVCLLLGGLSFMVGCGGSGSGGPSGGVGTNPPAPPPLVSIAVTPSTAMVNPTAPGNTQQFTATGTYSNHSMQNITSSVTWSASIGATITAGGLATGVTPNATCTIMATQGSISGTATLTVTNPLVSIAVTPSAPSIPAGFTQQFVATPTYADGSHSPAITSTWASSNTAVATISNSPGTQGLASGVAAGTTSITATSGSVTSAPAALTVTSATLQSIVVTPANAALVYQSPQQYTATGTFNDGSTLDITNSVTWASSDTTKITITVSGVATGVGTTSTPVTISATKGSVSGSTTATVVPPTVQSIAITSSTAASNPANLAQGTSRLYTAIATLSNGGTLAVTSQASWSSSATTIATVGLHTGVVKAATPITTTTPVTITVTYSGMTQTVQINVTNATVAVPSPTIPTPITVTPIAPSIPAGVSQKFTATATFNDSTTQDVSMDATWSSNNPSFATAGPNGNVSAVSCSGNPVTASITAGFGGQTGSAQLTVSAAVLQSIAITSPISTTTTLAPGSRETFLATGIYNIPPTQNLPTVTWMSSNSSVVSIVQGGVATGQSAGLATIAASYRQCVNPIITSPSDSVLVTSSPLASISVAPATASVPEAVGTQFTATGNFQNPTTAPQNLTTNVTWASSPASVATVSNSVGRQGFATGVSSGSAAMTAVFASVVSNAATLTVTTATLTSIAVTPSNPTVTHGTLESFTAKGTFSDGSVIDLTGQVTWNSSNTNVATINNIGQASTVAPGTTTITASFAQNGTTTTGTTVLTVN